MRFAKISQLIALLFFCFPVLFGCGGGGGGGGNTTQTPQTSSFINQGDIGSAGGTIVEQKTGATLIVPEGTFSEKVTVNFASATVPAFDQTILEVGPSFVISASKENNGELGVEISKEKLSVGGDKIKEVETFYYSEITNSWLPLPTEYDPQTGKVKSFLNLLQKAGISSSEVKIKYGVTDTEQIGNKCITTGGLFNGYYCQCGEETYWKNDRNGCVSIYSSSRLLNRGTNTYKLLTANVGMLAVFKECPVGGKLCFLATEAKIAYRLQFLSPDIVLLQETYHPWESGGNTAPCPDKPKKMCLDNSGNRNRQIERILNPSEYWTVCSDQVQVVSSPSDPDSNTARGAGYECIGIKRSILNTWKSFSIVSALQDGEPTGHKTHLVNVSENNQYNWEGDQDVGLIWDVVLKGNQAVRLINAHIMSPLDDKIHKRRKEQIDTLFNNYYIGSPRTFIAGDFNTDSDDNCGLKIVNGSAILEPFARLGELTLGGDDARCSILNVIKEGRLQHHSDLSKETQDTNIPDYTLDYVLSNFAEPKNNAFCTLLDSTNKPDEFRLDMGSGMDHFAYFCNGLDFGEPPKPLGKIRIELTWGSAPKDLDSHLTGPLPSGERFHIYFKYADTKGEGKNPYPEYARLDVDDVTSYGPEVTTIIDASYGTFRFSVHDYTNRAKKDGDYSTALRDSNATVKVRDENGRLLATYKVPYDTGTLWTVFEIRDGQLVEIGGYMTYENDERNVQKQQGISGTDTMLIRDLPEKKNRKDYR